jgi:hypothetical protein
MINKRLSYLESKGGKYIDFIKNCIMIIGSSFNVQENDTILDLEKACDNIDTLFGQNKRSVINIILRYIESSRIDDNTNMVAPTGKVSESFLNKISYRFFECLLINPIKGFCHNFYEYSHDKTKDLLIVSDTNGDNLEHRYFSNIYKYPSRSDVPRMLFTPFIKVRILQLLMNIQRIDDCDLNCINIKDVSTILSNLFSYREDVVKLCCSELLEDQSITFNDAHQSIEDFDREGEPKEYLALHITNRGEHVLSLLPINIHFLSICLEDIHIPVNILKTGFPIGKRIVGEEATEDYLFGNICVSLPKLVGLLEKVQEFEKKQFIDKNSLQYEIGNKKFSYSIFFNNAEIPHNDFNFITLLKKSTIDNINNIVRTYCFKEWKNTDATILKQRQDYLIKLINKSNESHTS